MVYAANTRGNPTSVRFFGKVFLSGKVSPGGNGAYPECGTLGRSHEWMTREN